MPLSSGHRGDRQEFVARGDRYDFAYATAPGRWKTLAADQDGTILSTKTAGGFVGVTFGLHVYSPATVEQGT